MILMAIDYGKTRRKLVSLLTESEMHHCFILFSSLLFSSSSVVSSSIMSFSHRRLLLFEDEKSTHAVLHAKKYDCDLCFLNDRDCPDQCKNDLDLDDQVFPISPPPLIPSRNNGSNNNTNNMPTILIMMLCVLGAAFVFLCYLTILKRYRSNLSSSSRRRRRRDMDTDTGTADGNRRGDLMDENHGQMMINPIWYINTVGLQQSVIDSIAVFRYKKGESLIESGDCSVCLSEFEEDEMLRVLPKCSHAFHIDCIDTWLRSHKNCPLCRAPIVRESIILEAEEEEESVLPMSNNNNSVSPENTSADDDEEEVSDHRHSISTTNLPEIGEENITDYPTGTSVDKNNDGIRVLSDLSDHHHHHRRVRRTGEEELQPAAVRRSISMDAKIPPPVIQEEEEKLELKKQNSDKVTTELMIIHKHNKSRKSFSFGRSLQKMPIRMKRSFSSSSHNSNSKSSSLSRNRNSRSQEIIQSF